MIVDVNEVLGVISAELDLDDGEIDADSTMDDVENWDSLGHLRVCMALESKFGVSIPMQTVPELGSVPSIMAMLSST